jgi:transglutaminase-like putative cysteine protease
MFENRRRLMHLAALIAPAAALGSRPAQAQAAPEPRGSEARSFEPQPGDWRAVEVTTRVEIARTSGPTQAWIPLPSVDDSYQQSLGHQWRGNAAQVSIASDGLYGAAILHARFEATQGTPVIEVSSRVRSQSRRQSWRSHWPVRLSSADAQFWTRATELMPTDGIVRETARKAIGAARTDLQKVQALYDWTVNHTWRDPGTRGCGSGNVRQMLESGEFGGKCADINALFVALCRAVAIPARDVYGIRTLPSRFGYRELGANSADITRAQHCRAEVFLQGLGWVAMDPADVGKVMRQESTQWIRDSAHPLVSPVRQALFGGWEGNWMGYNSAHDVALPGSEGPRVAFFMYPEAENDKGRFDALDPETFRYTIRSRALAG